MWIWIKVPSVTQILTVLAGDWSPLLESMKELHLPWEAEEQKSLGTFFYWKVKVARQNVKFIYLRIIHFVNYLFTSIKCCHGKA
jgi:hypothetical protein